MNTRSWPWRLGLFLTGALIFAGGPLHPGGTMAEMLAHHDWVPSHALVLAAFVAMLFSLVAYRGAMPLPPRSALWTRIAIVGAILQVIEMAFHTAAKIDLDNLLAGKSTPILTTHLWLAVLFYPIFALTAIGWIVATARDRALASPWISWLGILGLLGHGLAPVLVVALDVAEARVLFPMVILFALWCVLASLWPVKLGSASPPLVTN